MAVNLICREFGVNQAWLRTGEGEMFSVRTQNEEIAAFANRLMQARNEDFKTRFVLALSRMGPEGWIALEKFIDDITE